MSSSNKNAIVKNSIFLSLRSILVLFAGLYTTREILFQLGVEDFGIYNIVGSVIVLFSFIQNAINTATSRFFTFELGNGDFISLKNTFALSVVIHIFIALPILILGETIGLWFLNTQLVIPVERMGAANFVYQVTIFTACVGILQMPYTVAINAHEKMKIYAFTGIAEAALKVLVALSLSFATIDKLKLYSILLLAINVVMIVFYRVYCHKNFPETHFSWFWDKAKFMERLKFSGFELLGGISGVAAMQGCTMLVNRFYGVLLNSALGVSNQVIGASQQFVANSFASAAPQITKSLAKDDKQNFYFLIIRSSKFCLLIGLLIFIPLGLQIDFILNIWLKNVPDYAGGFCIVSLVNTLIVSSFWSVWHGIISYGKIRKFRLIDSFLISLIFLFTFIALHYSPIGYVFSLAFVNGLRSVYAAFVLRKLTGFPIRRFVNESLVKCSAAIALSLPVPLCISISLRTTFPPPYVFLSTCLTFLAAFIPASYFVVLSKDEKIFIKLFLLKLKAKMLQTR